MVLHADAPTIRNKLLTQQTADAPATPFSITIPAMSVMRLITALTVLLITPVEPVCQYSNWSTMLVNALTPLLR